MAPVLEARDVTVRFGGVAALDRFSCGIDDGQICGLIGPNGSGKTTFFNVVSRIYQPEAGSVRFGGRDVLGLPAHALAGLGIARTFQNLAVFPSMTLLQHVMVGAHSRGRVGFVRAVLRIGPRREERAMATVARELLERLGLAEHAHERAGGIAFPILKRLELARALACRPRLLLLDEPAAGLDHLEVEELGRTILDLRRDLGLTVLLVEHHMAMVMRLCDVVVAMEAGRTLAEGSPAEVSEHPAVVRSYLGVGR